MSRRPGYCIALDISNEEKEVIGIMRAKGGYTSDPNVCRSALWAMADQLGIDPPDGVFDQREHYDGSANLQKFNDARRKPKAQKAKRQRRVSQKQPSTHPWRKAKDLYYAKHPDYKEANDQAREAATSRTTPEEEAV